MRTPIPFEFDNIPKAKGRFIVELDPNVYLRIEDGNITEIMFYKFYKLEAYIKSCKEVWSDCVSYKVLLGKEFVFRFYVDEIGSDSDPIFISGYPPTPGAGTCGHYTMNVENLGTWMIQNLCDKLSIPDGDRRYWQYMETINTKVNFLIVITFVASNLICLRLTKKIQKTE